MQKLHLNFFRLHLLFFTITPLLFSGVLYAANPTSRGNGVTTEGPSHTHYIDCLFLCYSAMTCVQTNVQLKDSVTGLVTVNLSSLRPSQQALLFVLFILGDYSVVSLVVVVVRKHFFRLRCSRLLADDMHIGTVPQGVELPPTQIGRLEWALLPADPRPLTHHTPERTLASSPQSYSRDLPLADFPIPGTSNHRTAFASRQRFRALTRTKSYKPRGDGPSLTSRVFLQPTAAHTAGLGGFPSIHYLIVKTLPHSLKATIENRFSRPQRQQELLVHSGDWSDKVRTRVAQWLPETLSSLVVDRNGRFFTEELDDEDLVRIGGVEYRALNLLMWFVTWYILLFQIMAFGILSIYFATSHAWDQSFVKTAQVQAESVNKTWFSLFSAVSAYTGTGMSLVDQSVIPFSSCYVYIYIINLVMLAGNHALPMTLRFCIWIGSKSTRGETRRTLHFLLDHPRRCFLYLFPSHQTWYLVLILVAFSVVEIVCFISLNMDLPVLKKLGSGWQKFSDGLLQSLSVRASGFAVVNISNLAPAVLFLYAVFMYVAIYPIAMSVRATNVYEEQSLGIYEKDGADEEEVTFEGDKREVFSKYLMFHIRKQLSFDIAPLAFGVFLICCFERRKLLGEATSNWFSIFRIIFECTSGYSTIGLGMGVPDDNYSFSGAFGAASKVVMMGIMLRGRHRGLPVAIDRAILLPHEYTRLDKKGSEKAA